MRSRPRCITGVVLMVTIFSYLPSIIVATHIKAETSYGNGENGDRSMFNGKGGLDPGVGDGMDQKYWDGDYDARMDSSLSSADRCSCSVGPGGTIGGPV